MEHKKHYHIHVLGQVQGVGFRPYVYRIAVDEKLLGWVNNTNEGVNIHIETTELKKDTFCQRLKNEKPPAAVITDFHVHELPWIGFTSFKIEDSHSETKDKKVIIPPDLVICEDCRNELFDPTNRRYQYPFINCTNCGPRFSIIESVPYDRAKTSMKAFPLCPDCLKEYENPLDRRFHAEPNACPKCGPQIFLRNSDFQVLAEKQQALDLAIQALSEGKIIALKGIGGYQILVDASNASAIERLRNLKRRPQKPFAVMALDLKMVNDIAETNSLEISTLKSMANPIVLLNKKAQFPDSLAPHNPLIGVMLPSSGLHYLILSAFKKPIVATSGNISEEPICINEQEAFDHLKGKVDFFLTHNREIIRAVDDSVVRYMNGKMVTLRKARGLAPEVFQLPEKLHSEEPIMAVGPHQKNTICLKLKDRLILGQHIGDLDNILTENAFLREINAFCNFYEVKPETAISDLHPDYRSTIYAKENYLKVFQVQHHLAHIYSVMIENNIEGPLVGISWDGTGYGETSDTIFGGETFIIQKDMSAQRISSLLPIQLLGGEVTAKENYRIGHALLLQSDILDYNLPQLKDSENFKLLFHSSYKSFQSTSMGRLIEGLSALIGISEKNTFEGESAMRLEYEAYQSTTKEFVKMNFLNIDNVDFMDWRPLVRFIYNNLNVISKPDLARISLNSIIETHSTYLKKYSQYPLIVSGGAFQNKILLEELALRKTGNGFFFGAKVPMNDGGVSLGQAYFASSKLNTF